MAALKQLEAINEKLLTYQCQLRHVSEALDALRAVADRLVLDLEEDRALVVDLVVAFEGDEGLTQATDPAVATVPVVADAVQRLEAVDHLGAAHTAQADAELVLDELPVATRDKALPHGAEDVGASESEIAPWAAMADA